MCVKLMFCRCLDGGGGGGGSSGCDSVSPTTAVTETEPDSSLSYWFDLS